MDENKLKTLLSKVNYDDVTFDQTDRQKVLDRLKKQHIGAEPRKKRVRFRWMGPMVATLLLFGVAVGILFSTVSETKQQKFNDAGQRSKEDDHFAVLLMGKDTEHHADANILMTYNAGKQSIKMVSIPRDARVPIINPNNGKVKKRDKFMAAYWTGEAQGNQGPAFAMATVANLFDIPVDNYVAMSFKSFVKDINALGGLTLNVEYAMTVPGIGDRSVKLEAGKQQLNGRETLAYVRSRYERLNGNNGRRRAQLKVLKALINQKVDSSLISEDQSVMNTMMQNVETNFSLNQLYQLGKGSDHLVDNIELLELTGSDAKAVRKNGVYFMKLSQEAIADVSHELRQHLGLESIKN